MITMVHSIDYHWSCYVCRLLRELIDGEKVWQEVLKQLLEERTQQVQLVTQVAQNVGIINSFIAPPGSRQRQDTG
jgi:hypothetical protein